MPVTTQRNHTTRNTKDKSVRISVNLFTINDKSYCALSEDEVNRLNYLAHINGYTPSIVNTTVNLPKQVIKTSLQLKNLLDSQIRQHKGGAATIAEIKQRLETLNYCFSGIDSSVIDTVVPKLKGLKIYYNNNQEVYVVAGSLADTSNDYSYGATDIQTLFSVNSRITNIPELLKGEVKRWLDLHWIVEELPGIYALNQAYFVRLQASEGKLIARYYTAGRVDQRLRKFSKHNLAEDLREFYSGLLSKAPELRVTITDKAKEVITELGYKYEVKDNVVFIK